jgi:signal transduction histidine kinase
MPDGAAQATDDLAERDARAADARLVSGVRRRLIGWSGGTTLLILIVLGVALYVSVANSLDRTGTLLLESRAESIRGFGDPNDGPPTGFVFGGGASGTFAIILGPDGRLLDPRIDVPPGLPDRACEAAARVNGRDVRLSEVDGVPVRVLCERVATRRGDVVIQIVGDRTAEQQALNVLLVVLVLGGLVALLVAAGFGSAYARRALVPIRDSLERQRTALRYQRRFAADASHELRTPLTIIRSSIEHLRRHRSEPVEAVGDALDDIDAEVDHLASLVEDLLLLARSDSGAVPLAHLPVDLGDVAADAASALSKPAADRRVDLVVDPEPTFVEGDAGRLRQLVMILVDNAVRHSPVGGHVRVSVRSVGGTAQLVVEDDGPGIRPADMPHVFDRFWRAPGAPSGGTGLGLAIASWIVERHGGRIEVGDRPGGGARFTVRMPAGPDGRAGSTGHVAIS